MSRFLSSTSLGGGVKLSTTEVSGLYAGTYNAAIDALSPDHRWAFEGDSVDSIGAANGVETSITAGVPLCRDVLASRETNAIVNDRIAIPTTSDINNSVQSRKALGGWFSISKINAHPVRVYGEGINTLTYQIVAALGNNTMFEVVESGVVTQLYGLALVPNRNYQIYTEYQGTSFDNVLRFYIDGVLQQETTIGVPDLAARTAGVFGDPSTTVGIGGDVILLQAPVNGSYNQWCSWSNKVLPTALELRQEIFEKGAIPSVTITDQAGLDALSGTVRPNAPLCIYVEIAGSVNLTANNVTFDPLASIHVQYGGSGTLNWTNENGSNASIGSTINNGTINFINPATLTINGVINNSEIRIYDDEIASDGQYNTELDGVENNPGTSFSFSHDGIPNTVKVQMLAEGYEELILAVLLTSADENITLFPVVEVNA